MRVPRRDLLGRHNRGFVQVMQGFDYSRALIGLQCLALARISLDETWPYCAERNAFGKPLTAFQGVTFPLAECETQYQAARWLCLRTLWLRDVLGLQIGDGTAQIMKMIIARQMTGGA